MLKWSRGNLAKASSVAERTIIDFEREARKPYERTLRDIQRALEEGGIEFIDEDGGGGQGVGVMLR